MSYQRLRRGSAMSRRQLLGGLLASGTAAVLTPLTSFALAEDELPVRRTQIEANGISLHVVEQGRGPSVLFCHGFPDTAETWRSQMQAVAAAGYRAIALDMRGFGLSDAPRDSSAYTSLQISGDLVGVLDALSIPSAVLVGHDWGSTHVWQAMLLRPDRFLAAVGVSVPFIPRGDTSFYESVRKQGYGDRYYVFDFMKPDAEARWAPAARTIPSSLYWPSASPPANERWDPYDRAKNILRPAPASLPGWADPQYVAHQVETFERTGFHGGLNYYRAAQLDFDLTPAFRHAVIRQPTLYVFGRADGLQKSFHPTREELRHALPGLRDYVALDDVGHWVQHEAASQLNAAIVDFLRNLRLQGPSNAY